MMITVKTARLRANTLIAGLSKKFIRDTRANASLFFALAALPMFIAIGVAYDMTRANTVKARMQTAIDAAALAAASAGSMTNTARKAVANGIFKANFEKSPLTQSLNAVPQVTIAADKVSMSLQLDLPTAMMSVAGLDTMTLNTSVDVAIPVEKNAEIALVLDYSGSMDAYSGGEKKYISMKNAAISLVDDLTKQGTNNKVKFGLVPFSHHVRVTLPGDYVVGQAPGTTWTGCTQDRKAPYNTGVSTPLAGNDATRWGHPFAPVHLAWDCAPYAGKNLTVKPISNDYQGVINQLAAMQPYAWTHIALGFSFGWHLVDPGAPFTGVAPYSDPDTEKYIILLTDGRQTEPSFGPGTSRTVADGEANLASLCANAKTAGVTVVTVAFDLQDQATEDRLRDCASDPVKYFFIAGNGTELASAFNQIKQELAANIYISK